MQQQTPAQPGQPGGPGSIRRAPTTAPPTIRTREEQPLVRVRRPSSFMNTIEAVQSYLFSEETLILLEFLVVIAIGVVVFRIVLQPMETLVTALNHAISNLGLSKLIK